MDKCTGSPTGLKVENVGSNAERVRDGIILYTMPKFLHKKKHMRGMLEDRLVRQCLDLVLELLKWAACEGIMLSDPVGHSRYCFTSLAMMLATIGGTTSPVTMAMFKQFGDPQAFQHEPQTSSTTLTQIAAVRSKPVTGFRHFHGGMSKLKQVTGCAQCNIQHSIIVSPWINDHDIKCISTALAEFHTNKYAITAAGLRHGKGNKPIDNWSIRLETAKQPGPLNINQNIVDFDFDDDDGNSEDIDLPADLLTTVKCPGYAHPITDYFAMAKVLKHREVGLSSPLMMLPLNSAFQTYDLPSLTSFVMKILMGLITFTRLEGLGGLGLTLHSYLINCKYGSNFNFKIWNFTIPPMCGLCHVVAQIRLILCPITKPGTQGAWKDHFFMYVQHFNNSGERYAATFTQEGEAVKQNSHW
ncbi:hypothetical protein EV702DRAFT_1050025 [Suillus placidus]|uniref:Uncharacterized protein n=1 Tax=Suillus placidus TaxID=48579 RepID=A0A9P7CXN4_9AGAM|nr:hypothetical protein EV702DRAFT_1050025 [Suillus placidus]